MEGIHDGKKFTYSSQFICIATGQLRVPKIPKISGQDIFTGPSFHSSRWDSSVDFSNKKVAILGNGMFFFFFLYS